jgi:hypothetical protein
VLESLGIEQTVAVSWVKSLRSYGLTVNVEGRTLKVDAALSGDAPPIHADLPPGALAFRIPVKASDLEISEAAGVGVTLTTIEGGVEASTTGLRLRVQAGL